MKTLTGAISAEAAAAQSGWCEVYDFYLKAAITTPQGVTNVLRLTNYSGNLSFFAPTFLPEPAGMQGTAIVYQFWPIKRELVRGTAKFQNDKLTIAASNVSQQYAQMLADVDWYDTPVVIRKVNTAIAGPTSADCVTLFVGQVDAARIDLKAVQFSCSNDLSAFNAVLPRENMHTSCRFNWADDYCTQIRFLPANYKSKTAGAACTTTQINSAGLTEDTGNDDSALGTDLVNALLDTAITASSEQAALSGAAVTFSLTQTEYDPAIYEYCFSVNNGTKLKVGTKVRFAAVTMPTGLTAGVWYYVEGVYSGRYRLETTPGAQDIIVSTSGNTVTVDTQAAFAGSMVRDVNGGYWKFSAAGDWGTITQGYWSIPVGQDGLANFALKPWVQFDFGSAQQPKHWRVQSVGGLGRESMVRLLVFFSSTDNVSWKHETYFETPPIGDTDWDVLIPNAQSARYWRICVRSRWSDTLEYTLLKKVKAYTGSRNFWQNGSVKFDAATATVALRNISRPILESYSGKVIVAPLPVAPANGDAFVIERGCARIFNACCARKNWENFGGFDSLPYETPLRA